MSTDPTENMRQHFKPDGQPERLDGGTAGANCAVGNGSANCVNCKNWRRFHRLSCFGSCSRVIADPFFGEDSSHASRPEEDTCAMSSPNTKSSRGTAQP